MVEKGGSGSKLSYIFEKDLAKWWECGNEAMKRFSKQISYRKHPMLAAGDSL